MAYKSKKLAERDTINGNFIYMAFSFKLTMVVGCGKFFRFSIPITRGENLAAALLIDLFEDLPS